MSNLPGWKRIAETWVGDTQISTVYIDLNAGLPSSFSYHWEPLIETMVFGDVMNEWQWRWPNEVAALAGHDQVVETVKEAERDRNPAG